MALSKTEMMERDIWFQSGVDRGWVSEPWCSTHDIDPTMTEEEAEEWEQGGDPCCVVIRVL